MNVLFPSGPVSYICCTQNMSLAAYTLCTEPDPNLDTEDTESESESVSIPESETASHLPPCVLFVSGGEGLPDCHWRSEASPGVRILCPRVPSI